MTDNTGTEVSDTVSAPDTASAPDTTSAPAPQKRVHCRLHGLDTLRGVTLLSMIGYHAMWDLVYLFHVQADWYHSDGARLWQQSICWTFILLSGFCHALGHHPVRRGLLVTGASLLLTLVTLIFMPEERVVFGVLTLIGLSMLLCVPLGHLTKKLSGIGSILCAIGTFLLFLLTKHAQSGTLSLFGVQLCTLPDALYQNLFTALLGFPPDGFFSTDYFPLIPWFFLYLTGLTFYRIADVYDWLPCLVHPNIPPLSFLGRHSLLIYLLHQPLIYGILFMLFYF